MFRHDFQTGNGRVKLSVEDKEALTSMCSTIKQTMNIMLYPLHGNTVMLLYQITNKWPKGVLSIFQKTLISISCIKQKRKVMQLMDMLVKFQRRPATRTKNVISSSPCNKEQI